LFEDGAVNAEEFQVRGVMGNTADKRKAMTVPDNSSKIELMSEFGEL
jgi:hypothetical protein